MRPARGILVVSGRALEELKRACKKAGLKPPREETEYAFTLVEVRPVILEVLKKIARREGISLEEALEKILSEI